MISSCPRGNSHKWSQQSCGLSPRRLHPQSNSQLAPLQAGTSRVATAQKHRVHHFWPCAQTGFTQFPRHLFKFYRLIYLSIYGMLPELHMWLLPAAEQTGSHDQWFPLGWTLCTRHQEGWRWTGSWSPPRDQDAGGRPSLHGEAGWSVTGCQDWSGPTVRPFVLLNMILLRKREQFTMKHTY